ncbi:response regulator transcription factor [Fusibacter sp. JL298sf-3]
MFRLLIAEDEPQISGIIKKYIENEGYTCDVATTGVEALEAFSEHAYHLLVLDVMMPGVDGFEVLEKVRSVSDVPVILLTAKVLEADRIKGFDYGADDYVTKPFSPRELMKRISVLLKRVYKTVEGTVLSYGPFKLDIDRMVCFKDGESVSLTATEFKLFAALVENAERVLTREQMIERAFGFDYEGFDRNIDSYIKNIRQKVEETPKHPKYLRTKYGVGYVLGGGKDDC